MDDVHDGNGGAPLMGGVAPGVAGWDRLWVGWLDAAELMEVSGTAVGFVECSDAKVVLKRAYCQIGESLSGEIAYTVGI